MIRIRNTLAQVPVLTTYNVILIRDVPDIRLAGYPAGYPAIFLYPVSGRIPDMLCRISGIRLSPISGRISDSADSKHVPEKQATI